MKIGVIHATCNAVPSLNNAFKELAPDATVVNLVNENLQHYSNEIGGIDDRTHRDYANLAFMAQGAGVDAIIVACTVLTPILDVVKPFITVPIMAVDRPMLENAAGNYDKIGVVVTNEPSGPLTRSQLENIAKDNGKEIKMETKSIPEAMAELKAGNEAEHNRLNALAAQELKDSGCEVIVFSQITQTTAEKETGILGIPTLTSPKEAVKAVIKLVK
ncbi:aspartate/glutamate racemase family protein [Salibacterium aidingense]|uniref:aspartate/glutamate racemase family protein n=1 Tax=Salibacterium aidingense TaxID=384933 RepID=UPI0003F5B60F|nr:aspartate/glutamate racemase family protein [Salibacterium aidingense]